jgi:16S rRNA (uracil1498-N3)-methyltransferase
MRVPRIYLPADFSHREVALDRDTTRRLASVRRLGEGDKVRLFDGSGNEAEGMLAKGARSVTIDRTWQEEETLPEIHLYPALIKANRFDWLVEKATELGASTINPVVCARSLPDKRTGRLDRWQRIAAEAAEQSERTLVPRLAAPQPFAAALTSAPGVKLIAWEGQRDLPFESAVSNPPLSLFSGPEGGYTDSEIETATASGAQLIGLGPLTLRAETAAIVMLARASAALTTPRARSL